MSEQWWLRLVVRIVLALLALGGLAFATNRQDEFIRGFASTFRYDVRLWLAWVGTAAAGGCLFGLAAWIPFTRVRYLWSRLLLAALPLLPLVQFWWVYIEQHGHQTAWEWLVRTGWLLDASSQTAVAVLVGVAIASGFRTARSDHA
jgi:hypothetical protein